MTQNISEVYRYCPRCGSDELAKDGLVLARCEQCDFRVFFTPPTNVSVLLFRASGESTEVMLSWRKQGPVDECWQINGGFVLPGEDPEVAARRHLLRETGIDLAGADLRIFCAISEKYHLDGCERDICCVYYYAHYPQGAVPIATEESSRCEFFLEENLPVNKIGYPCDRTALERFFA